jgi:hypothetical protein
VHHQDLEVATHALFQMGLECGGIESAVNRSHRWMRLGPQRKILLAQGGELVARQVAQREAGGSIE